MNESKCCPFCKSGRWVAADVMASAWKCIDCQKTWTDWMPRRETQDPMFCEHANENPNLLTCDCPPDCYCWSHTCSAKRVGGWARLDRESARRRILEAAKVEAPTDMGQLVSCESYDSDGFEKYKRTADVLTWVASRPGVLSLLEALRAANYDETGTEYLRRIVDRRPVPGTMNGPTVPLEMVVPEWAGCDDFGGEDFVCFTGTEEEKRATYALLERRRQMEVDAEKAAFCTKAEPLTDAGIVASGGTGGGPTPAPKEKAGVVLVGQVWRDLHDGTDWTCVSVGPRVATWQRGGLIMSTALDEDGAPWSEGWTLQNDGGAAVDPVSSLKGSVEAPALKVEAPALKVDPELEGRHCAIIECGAPAVTTRYTWDFGRVPLCDRHAKEG